MRVRRLLSHLAQFASFSNQGELLCTQGLAYLLENPEAGAAFGVCISKRAGRTVGSDLTWRAEVRHKDGRRPDLEAYTADGKLAAMIEAKLDAALGEGQLRSYVADLTNRCVGGLLLVLVPRYRDEEMTTSVPSACRPSALNGDGPWQLGDTSDCSVAVIYWEEVLEALGSVRSEPFADDLAQFQTMYRVLIGDDIEPFTSDAELRAWREREGVFVTLVNRVTHFLTPRQRRILPMRHERDPYDYQLRYVCQGGTEQPCFSVGAGDPFEGQGHITPIWLRFHHDTPKFSVIHDALFASSLSQRLVEKFGHIWIPLDVPLNAGAHRLKASLVAQAEEVIQVAYQPLP